MDWLLGPEGLAVVRRAYARQMLGIGNIRNDRLELAYATIRREPFLGPEPWQIVQWPPGPLLPANDPVYVYQDVVLALAPERGVNNGSPSLHAKMLNDLAVGPARRPYRGWCRLLHRDAGRADRAIWSRHRHRVQRGAR